MNKLDFTQPGGLPLYAASLDFLQQSSRDALAGFASGFVAADKGCIISGCEIAAGYCSPGWILFKGEVVKVDGHACFDGAPSIWRLTDTPDATLDPTRYKDAAYRDAHRVRRAIVEAYPATPPTYEWIYRNETTSKPMLTLKQLIADAAWEVMEPRFATASVLSSFDTGTGLGLGRWQNWALCNGANGTPDLRGRFVVGHNPTDGQFDTVGETGGAKQATLQINNLPDAAYLIAAHSTMESGSPAGVGFPYRATAYLPLKRSDNPDPGGSTLMPTNPFSILPPYYTLGYICRIA